MPTIPTVEPASIRSGDTIKWRREDLVADYPAPTWSLVYELRNSRAQAQIAAAADGDQFAVTVLATASAAFEPGEYSMLGRVTDGTEVVTVYHSTMTIEKDLAALGQTETRAFWTRVRDNIQAVIEGTATKDQSSFSVAGRSLSRRTIEELITLHDRAQREVVKADRQERLAKGLGTNKRIETRFTT